MAATKKKTPARKRAGKTGSSRKTKAAGDSAVDPRLDQVRELLFGEEIHDNRERVSTLEARVDKELRGLRKQVMEHLETVERSAADERADAAEKLAAETAARESERDQFQKQLAELGKQLEKQSAHLETLIVRSSGELQRELRREAKALTEECERQHAELVQEVEAELEELRTAKLEKGELSAHLADVALRLVDKKQIRRSREG